MELLTYPKHSGCFMQIQVCVSVDHLSQPNCNVNYINDGNKHM